MKVAVTDFTFPSLDVEELILKPTSAVIVSGQCKTTETLIELVHDADVVMTQFATINAKVVAAMQRARVIVRYGIGVDNVDLDAARERGIPVCNVPDYCIDEVADHTLAFILAATRQVVINCVQVRSGVWGLAVPLAEMRTLRDLTVGLVGFGRIGREVAGRLAPFKCRRLVHDPIAPPAEIWNAGCEPVALADLLSASDVITLHCPSTSQTRRLLNAESIDRLMPGAIVVNLSRGDLIDTPALIEGLRSGKVGAAAIDVCDPEPIPPDSPLLTMSNVVVSAHIASTSVKAVRTLRESAARIAVLAIQGKALPNVVNGVRSSSSDSA